MQELTIIILSALKDGRSSEKGFLMKTQDLNTSNISNLSLFNLLSLLSLSENSFIHHGVTHRIILNE